MDFGQLLILNLRKQKKHCKDQTINFAVLLILLWQK
jgi:hypothetical protein